MLHTRKLRKRKGSCQILVNCGRGSTSTTSSSKITASSNDWSSSGWVSFPPRRRGELYRDMKPWICSGKSDPWRRKRRQHEAGGIHRQPGWSSCL